MRESNRTNVSAVAMFDQSLDKYEESLSSVGTDPTQYAIPAQHLQMALNRLITANVPDAYQMMRHLTERMITGANENYSEYSLLMVASGSPNNVFKDEIMAITYVLLEAIRGSDPNLDLDWRNRVNANSAIENFLKHYKTSDQKKLNDVYKGNTHTSTSVVSESYSSENDVVISITPNTQEINLTAMGYPTVNFILGGGWSNRSDYRTDLPKSYKTTITIKPNTGEFFVPKTVKFTDTAAALVNDLGCVPQFGSTMTAYRFKLPGQFFACKLDLVSFDSGMSWIIGNVQIIPPTLRVM